MDRFSYPNKDFDLDEAAMYLEKNCRRWARMGIWTKEKYGTLRVSTTAALFTEYDFLHHIFWPGYCYIKWPVWFRVYVDWPFGKVMGMLGIIRLLQRYQNFVLRFFWKRAAKKWPHIKEEILAAFKEE